MVGVVEEAVEAVGDWGGWCFAWDSRQWLRLSCSVSAFD